MQITETVSEADPYYTCSKELTVSNRLNIHQHTEQKKGISIASLNINGLHRHFNEISSFLNQKGIHILAMNETKVENSYSKQLMNILGYQQERKDRTTHGGGVVLYIREPIQYTRRTDLSPQDLEIICVEIQSLKSKPYIVIAWYSPPNNPVDSFNKLETNLL